MLRLKVGLGCVLFDRVFLFERFSPGVERAEDLKARDMLRAVAEVDVLRQEQQKKKTTHERTLSVDSSCL